MAVFFMAAAFRVRASFLGVAVGVLAFLFFAGLTVFFPFCPGAFFFFAVSPFCFFSRRFLALPINSPSFSVFFFSLQQHVPSFLFLSFPSPLANGTCLSQPQVISGGQHQMARAPTSSFACNWPDHYRQGFL